MNGGVYIKQSKTEKERKKESMKEKRKKKERNKKERKKEKRWYLSYEVKNV